MAAKTATGVSVRDQLREWTAANPLRVWRTQEGISMMQAASLLGVGMSTVQGWEAGSNFPSDENLVTLGRAVGNPGIMADWQKWYGARPRV